MKPLGSLKMSEQPVPPTTGQENKVSTAHFEDSQHTIPEKTHNGDTALALFAHGDGQNEPIDPAENKRLVRKIDWMILPFLAICYAFYYVSTGHIMPWQQLIED